MRPVPRSRHLAALLIFAAVAILSEYLSLLDQNLSDPQIATATTALKRYQCGLYTGDPVYGSDLWRFQTPAFQSILEMALVPTGYGDPTMPFRAMTGVLVMVYLCGMYALLYRQCRSWSVSVFVTVLSSTVTYTLGRSFWGVGSLASITPPALIVAVVPLVVLTFIRYLQRWQLLLVFGFVGLLGNLHLVSAMNLTLVLLIVYLGIHRFAPRSWPTAIGCGLAALVGAMPYAGYYFGLRAQMSQAGATVSAAVVRTALAGSEADGIYPEIFSSMVNWMLLVAVLVIPAVAVLSRVERFRVRDLRVWVWFFVGALFVSLGLQGLSQFVGWAIGQGPPVIDFVRASNLAMLPLYVLFAQALTNLFRIVRAHRAWLRAACAAFMIAWMAPSDNFRVVRYALLDTATAFMDESDKPRPIQKHHERDAERRELIQIGRWAQAKTSRDAIFLFDQAEFRMFARRGIVGCPDDVIFFYYMTPWRLEEWLQTVKQQERVLRSSALGGRADPEAIVTFAKDLARKTEFAEVKEWYTILDALVAPDKPGALKPIAGEGWGAQYRVYRVN